MSEILYLLSTEFYLFLFLAASGVAFTWAFSSCSARASHCCGFSCCGAQALDAGFSSCGTPVQSLWLQA